MSRRRTVEYSPHYDPEPRRPLKFGEPLPRSHRGRQASLRKPLSGSRGVILQDLGLVPTGNSEGVISEVSRGKRGWETYTLDRGTGTQETIEGRSYSIGADHASVDIWTSPSGTWGADRIGSVKNVKIITLKRKGSKQDESSDVAIDGWTQAMVVAGASKPKSNVITPIQFNDRLGFREIISVEWQQIRR